MTSFSCMFGLTLQVYFPKDTDFGSEALLRTVCSAPWPADRSWPCAKVHSLLRWAGAVVLHRARAVAQGTCSLTQQQG